VAPTVLAVLGIDEGEGMDGRVLVEALAGRPDAEQVAADTHAHTVDAGAYRAALQMSTVDGRRYVDKSWRMR
jgi:arylsulfatase A-like enzyme